MSGRRNRKPRRSEREPRLSVRWVRTPIQLPRGRLLLVLIYARFSTDEQKHRSIKAQVDYCKRCLKALGIDKAKVIVISDEATSGELVSRPGIDRVREGVSDGAWDLILVEDSSRLFRDEVACLQLVGLAVDRGIRTICINDFVDTSDEDWEQRLREAAQHHSVSNRYCSQRIKRAHEELWEIGAAVGPLKSGYRRNPSVPATKHRPEEGPFFDEVDPEWSPIVRQAYERIAAGEMPWTLAEWLTEVGLPKTGSSGKSDWCEKNAIALIRRTDYRGYLLSLEFGGTERGL